MLCKKLIFTGLLLGVSTFNFAQDKNAIPHLEKRGEATQLIVDGNPYLILGGELHNSSTSSLEYLQPILPKMSALNLNTVLAAVTWDLMEPKEGKYDFTLVDGLLKQARQSNLRLIVLWFGTWKNGLSHYTPDWMKEDYKRFPRVKLGDGSPTETISPLSKEARDLDAKAFAALMKHLKETDKEKTVIMVQVENEIGVIGAPRDYSTLANSEFAKEVPQELLKNLKQNQNELQPLLKQKMKDAAQINSGTWSQVFGAGHDAEEIFMAYQYASYLEAVAAAGKAQYNLPMFVNAWVVQPEDKTPGDYPSGGPQAHNHDIYRFTAPHIDMFSPDIYLPNFKEITSYYKHDWNPLFIPESFSDATGAASAFYTVGFYKGLGYSPFGIDGILGVPDGKNEHLSKAYAVLSGLSSEILKAQASGAITGVYLTASEPKQVVTLGGYQIEVALRRTREEASKLKMGYAVIINSGTDEFILSGANLQFTFLPNQPGPKTAGLASVFEGKFVNGKWVAGRKLNGDNIMLNYRLADEARGHQTGTVARFESADPETLKVKLYRFD